MAKIKQCYKPALAALLCGLLLFVSLLAVNPALHQFFHPDAGTPGHTCLVELFVNGLVASPEIVSVLIAAVFFFAEIDLFPVTNPSSAPDHLFSQSRAPPAVL